MTTHASNARPARPRRQPGTAITLVALAGSLVALSGCADLTMSDQQALYLDTPTQRHAIGFRSGRAQLDIEVPPGGDTFSPNQQSDALSFFTRYQAEATGPLYVMLPYGARGNDAARQLRELAQESGVSPTSVRIGRNGAREGAFVRMSYNRREVDPPVCGDWSENLGRNHQRVHYPNFGCATQRNTALMVANPRDLQRPQAEDHRSSEKRSVDWTKYVGQAPGASGASPPDSASKATPKAGSNSNAAGVKQ